MEELFTLVINLFRCAHRQSYDPFPFSHLYTGDIWNRVKPSSGQLRNELVRIAGDADRQDLAELIRKAYPDEILDGCSGDVSPVTPSKLQDILQEYRSFSVPLLGEYFAERLSYREQYPFYKLPRFEVLELLSDETFGLYGFRMHFSNGNSAIFARYVDSTECINVHPKCPVNFWVGELEKLRDEWWIGEKRLYQIGLPGRYNKLGEWKPIVYPGKYEALENEAKSLSQDYDVQQVLFYMMCTGHRVIEFVVWATLELPAETVNFDEKIFLWQCPISDSESHPARNSFIYDGWLELETTDPESIRHAIAGIGIALNRMAFAYGAAVRWRLKYGHEIEEGLATPSEEDFDHLNALLRNYPRAEDAFILDAAIDWFNRGRSSRNVFTAFLCYYIALESVALAVADGKVDLGLGYRQESKEEKRQQQVACIQEMLEQTYHESPVRFVQNAYFDCVLSLKRKTSGVVESVFGANHEYLQMLFEKREGYSLSSIRGQLAHGGFALIDWEHEDLVRERLPEIAAISKEFLMRIIFGLRPDEPLPRWSGKHYMELPMADPRSTKVVTTNKLFPSDIDWKIKLEWIY